MPNLHVGEPLRAAPFGCEAAALQPEIARLRAEGWASLEEIVPGDLCTRLAAGLRCLHDANIPSPFLYVFDEAWQVAAGLAAVFRALIGGEPWLCPDVWAWFIAPGHGARGWAPHRGVSFDVRDAEGAPKLVNVWIALSDVAEDAACMHVVPLEVDPHYPHALDRVDVAESLGVPLPVPAGSVLAWNANVLHWGGRMTTTARPRISMSFTVSRDAEVDSIRPGETPTFRDRVDLVADMLVTYEGAAHVTGEWLDWARLSRGMRTAHGTRRRS